MSEIRCPICGKLNPEGSEDCQFCQAKISDSGLPDWLNSLRREDLGSLTPALADDQSDEDLPGWLLEEPGDAHQVVQPDEMDRLESSSPDPAAAAGETPAADDPEPEWLHRIQIRQNLNAAEAGQSLDSTSGPAVSLEQGSLPGVQMPAEGEPPFDENIAPEPASDLAPAELPHWLEVLRPSAAVAAVQPEKEERDWPVESSGPLSGLRGVLPAEPDIAQVKKPTVNSTRLQITQGQQSHISILEELVKTEGQNRPIPARSPGSSPSVLRLIIFIVLFLGIALPAYTGSQTVSLPALLPEVDDLNTSINGLSSGAPVLLAVDYQPGFSPEMDAAAGAVVDHLMLKGAYLTLVTTTSTGPAQAERLTRLVRDRGGHQYQSAGQYTNLGFIPGGAAGLLGFAETPRRILPYSQEGIFAWSAAPLQAVEGIRDFTLVLVITENPDTARAWIEQVQPELGNTPLLMVLSAQAEPVVRPYYDGSPRQVEGFVAGLAGGAAYENLQARPSLARKYWDSFSMAILLAAGLIVAGGAASIVSARLADRKKAVREDPV